MWTGLSQLHVFPFLSSPAGLSVTGFSAVVTYCVDELCAGEIWVILLVTALTMLALFFLFCITRQPQSHTKLNFMVPCVPYVPAFSCLVNIYLMFKLDSLTWIRFCVWMVIGFSVYFLCGINNATMGQWYATTAAGFAVYFLYGINNATMGQWYAKSSGGGGGGGGSDPEEGSEEKKSGCTTCCGPARGKIDTAENSDTDRYDSLGDVTP
ncbi:hypothetical protein ACOMHN_010623 [Nucella lapillus]